MSREEKINQLNDIFAEINEDDYLTSEDKIIEWKKDFKEYVNSLSMLNDDYKGIMEYVDELPVTSQEPCEDAISRQEVIDTIFRECSYENLDIDFAKVLLLQRKIKALPSVQSKYNPDEWCKTCSEYDHDKHCCPRYNKVIRNAVEEMKQEQEPCDKCEVGNPCLYCKHEFEPQESEETDADSN